MICYRNTTHTLPGINPFFDHEPRGIAYETDTHFVHFFGKDLGHWVISPALTVTEAKGGSLDQWAMRTFGAVDIEACANLPGHAVEGVWRPGLFFDVDVLAALNASETEVRQAEQSLLLLLVRLEEILNYIEPNGVGLEAYGHKTRELLIIACTEAENYWKQYLRLAGKVGSSKTVFTTKDYVSLKDPLHLEEFEVTFTRYKSVSPLMPFKGWDQSVGPTQSLPWYHAYNKTKHDRERHFGESSLRNCISAVAANVVLFSVRFGPSRLFHGTGTLAAQCNQLLSLRLDHCDPSTFYAPLIEVPHNQRPDLVLFNSTDLTVPWQVDQLSV